MNKRHLKQSSNLKSTNQTSTTTTTAHLRDLRINDDDEENCSFTLTTPANNNNTTNPSPGSNNNAAAESDEKSSSLSSASYYSDSNEGSGSGSATRTTTPTPTPTTSRPLNKPHKGNDIRWEAIHHLKSTNTPVPELGLGHFRLLKKLGFGDIGSVYLAELRTSTGGSGCLFAMKVMDKGMLASRKKLTRADTEREILSLLDHPFLPTLYSHFETEKFSCLLMEFCNGGDLHILRQRQIGKHFSEHAARFYASEVLLALEYLHMMGVIYRDLKPENVLVREDGHIMLSDFDLSLRCNVNPTLLKSTPQPSCSSSSSSSYCIEPSSCLHPSTCIQPSSCLQPSCFIKPRRFFKQQHSSSSSSQKKTTTHHTSGILASNTLPVVVVEPTTARSMSFVGTHEYLSPEIIRGDGHGSAVDWWTFGIFLYELLYGKTPFKGNNGGNRETLLNVVSQPLKFPTSDGNVTISFAAKDLIRGLLVKDPQKRLGYKRGATEIKQHPFFGEVNWALIRGNVPPDVPKKVDLSVFSGSSRVVKEGSGCGGGGGSTTSTTKCDDLDDGGSSPYLDFEFF